MEGMIEVVFSFSFPISLFLVFFFSFLFCGYFLLLFFLLSCLSPFISFVFLLFLFEFQ